MLLKKKSKGGYKKSKRPSVEVLSELYTQHTAKEIAVMYDVAPSTVRTWIATYRKQLKEVDTDA